MKIVRYEKNGDVSYGVIRDGKVFEILGLPYGGIQETGKTLPLESVRLLVPCEPASIVAVGLNYRSHIEEIKMEGKMEPVVFPKVLSSLAAPEDDIIKPPACKRLDYEAELAVVIGKRCAKVKKEDAAAYIFGYTCLNDVTARDLQSKTNQWMRAKGFYSFCPVGPWIETQVDPSRLEFKTVLNGKTVQKGNTELMIFDIPFLIEYISDFMELLPGDIIATGTTSGIGPMKPGDTVEIQIEGIGSLRNYVK